MSMIINLYHGRISGHTALSTVHELFVVFLLYTAMRYIKFHKYYRNVEELTNFSGLPQKKQLSYSTKQLIAREVCYFLYIMCFFEANSKVTTLLQIEVEKLRRAEVFLTKRFVSMHETYNYEINVLLYYVIGEDLSVKIHLTRIAVNANSSGRRSNHQSKHLFKKKNRYELTSLTA